MATREIKHVELKVASKNIKVKHPKTGILAGIKIEEEETFISILEDAGSSLYFNSKYYNILRVKIEYVDSIARTFFETGENEQKKAIEEVKKAVLKLRELGIADSKGGINLAKYKALPANLKKSKINNVFGLNIKQKQLANKKNVNNVTDLTKVKSTKNASSYVIKPYNNTHTKPEKTVTYIRRRTKKPSPEFLTDLKKKVAQITKGVYKSKDLPIVIDMEGLEVNGMDAEFIEREKALEDQYGGHQHSHGWEGYH